MQFLVLFLKLSFFSITETFLHQGLPWKFRTDIPKRKLIIKFHLSKWYLGRGRGRYL